MQLQMLDALLINSSTASAMDNPMPGTIVIMQECADSVTTPRVELGHTSI
jgi:hypothetical protein